VTSTGLIAVLVVLAACSLFGLWRQRTDGRVRTTRTTSPKQDDGAAAAKSPEANVATIGPDAIGSALGERATLLQFSSTFCQPCRAAAAVLSRVSETNDGVRHVEVDVADRLDLARHLRVMRTPTTLVLDSQGRELARAGGVPRLQAVTAVLEQIPR
jgi:thiol-disulfide isomerase/thioredoxin